MSAPPRPTPSTRPPRPLLPLAVIMAGCGVAAMVLAWIKVAGTLHVDRQISWTGLSLVGAVLFCTGVGLAATSGERVFLLHLHRLGTALAVDAGPTALAGPAASVGPDGLVAGSTMSRYHRPGCTLVTGKPVSAAGRDAHERAGRRPCGVCGAGATS